MKLTKVFAALSSKFSEHEEEYKERVIQILTNHGINSVQSIQIYDVCTNVDLQRALERSKENFLVGKESLIYLKEGIYDASGKCKTPIVLQLNTISILRTLCFIYFRLDQTTHERGFCGRFSREEDYNEF